jgi:hypothetical protein
LGKWVFKTFSARKYQFPPTYVHFQRKNFRGIFPRMYKKSAPGGIRSRCVLKCNIYKIFLKQHKYVSYICNYNTSDFNEFLTVGTFGAIFIESARKETETKVCWIGPKRDGNSNETAQGVCAAATLLHLILSFGGYYVSSANSKISSAKISTVTSSNF